jgi:tetratricopeptide (TPR) repeat protein
MKNSRVKISAAVALIALSATLGCSSDPNVGKQKFLKSGMRFVEKKDYGAAIVQFRNALKFDPRFAEAFYRMGQAQLANNNAQAAYAALRQAVELAPNRTDARLALARLQTSAGEYKNAEEQASLVLKQDEGNGDAMLILAGALTAQRQNAKAAAELRRLTSAQPHNALAYMDLGLVEVASIQYSAAERDLKQALSLDPRLTEAYRNLASLFQLERKDAEIEKLLEAATENNPDNPSLYVERAGILLAHQRKAEATAVLSRLRQRSPRSKEVALSIGDFYFQSKDFDSALHEYRRADELDGGDPEVKRRLTEVFLAKGQVKDAELLNNRILRKLPKNAAARLAGARILLAQGKKEEAISELRQQLRDAADSAQVHYWLARAYQANAQLNEAKMEGLEAVRLAPDSAGLQHFAAALLLDRNELEAAQEHAERAVKLASRSADEHFLLGIIYQAQKRYADGREQFAAAMQLSPNTPAVLSRIGEIDAAQRKWADADKEFEGALAIDPKFTPALKGLAQAFLDQGKPERAIARVETELSRLPGDADGHFLLGALYLNSKKFGLSRHELETATQLNPKFLSGFLTLAQVEMLTGSTDEALVTYRKALELQPRSAFIHSAMGNAYLKKNNAQLARKHYEDAISIDQDFAPALANLAWLDAEYGGNLDMALSRAQKAKELMPDQASISDTLAWVEYKKGIYSSAVPLLQECVNGTPTSPSFRYHLGMALLASGDSQKGKAQLESALQLHLKASDEEQARKALRTQ